MKNRFFLAIICTLLPVQACLAQNPATLQDQQMDLLAKIQSLTELPQVYPLPESNPNFLSDPVPQSILKRFEFYRSAIFPGLSIPLRICHSDDDGNSGLLLADYANSAVCLYPNDVRAMLKLQGQTEESPLLDYFLVHELAHFVHELSIRDNKVDSLSLGGNISIYRSERPVLNNGLSSLQAFARSHAEVDQYAILVFKRIKINIPYALIKGTLQSFIKEARASGYEDEPSVARLHVFEESESQSKKNSDL